MKCQHGEIGGGPSPLGVDCSEGRAGEVDDSTGVGVAEEEEEEEGPERATPGITTIVEI